MPALAQPLAAAPGAGSLRAALVAGESAVLSCASTSPLRLFTPRSRGRAVWAVATTHGGGLVAGDAIDVEVAVERGATALLATQSNTRVYRSTGAVASQRLRARVAEGALLAVLPEPTACFAGARFEQEQRFEVEEGGSLLLLDAFTEGRGARGERWAFHAYASRNEIALSGRLALADAVRLAQGEGAPPAARMDGLALVATAVAVGPALRSGAAALLEALASAPVDPAAEVLAAASPLADGLHLRVAARTVVAGAAYLRRALAFAAPLLGGSPFDRRP
ncbi:urease accessory protein UreD [Anaeromyxobacter diazotrophicus]|uniref:Urease accessory protein UreD n=1 Tax=Anaeromyxobacter diazotrophicus TaxID=2590199 RepID=A0A7I9VGD4_9BACT|nr:urease accessory protein UreD [Anaeromyxobacter diazotrophicus]GEJ55451.1 hypothetical protein AMYX_01920 [Anaeromyxobacter diazotrophicus]